MSILAISEKDKKAIVIERRCYSAFTISNPSLDDEHRYIQSFVYQFISTIFNFNNKNYVENMKKAGSLMSLNLWKKKRNEVLKISKEIKETNFYQTFEILNLEKIRVNTFTTTLKTFYHKNGTTLEDKITIKILIQNSELREDNPWGMEVENYSLESF